MAQNDSLHHMGILHFVPLDYASFTLLIILSCSVGLYYGCFAERKQNTIQEYMLGGKNLNIFAVSASLVASHISATTLLGVPADVYAYGTQYWMIIIPVTCVALALVYIYLPVYHDRTGGVQLPVPGEEVRSEDSCYGQLCDTLSSLHLRPDRRIRAVNCLCTGYWNP